MEVSELMGLSMRMTEDQLSRDALAASATLYTCTGGNNGDRPTNISVSDIDQVTTGLISNDAWMILDREIGELRFCTAPKKNGRYKLSLIDLEALA